MKKPQFRNRTRGILAVCAALSISSAHGQYTQYWRDSYDTTVTSTDINFQNTTRQAGTPFSYVTNVRPPNTDQTDYHHQIAGPGVGTALLLAGDAGAGLAFPDPTVGIAMASPVADFSGTGDGGIIGKRITFSLDVNQGGGTGGFNQAGINIGGNTSLVLAGSAATHFGVRFIEDTLSTPNYFVQFYDGVNLVGNLLPNPAGAGAMNVQLDINDLSDGNPWDGVGSTTVDLMVNSSLVGSYTKANGGYTANNITLEGSANFAGFGLGLNFFDELAVYAAPVPEPSSLALVGLGLAGWMLVRRRR